MGILINQFINMIVNILLFSAIPCIWYLVMQRTTHGFLDATGLFFSKKQRLKDTFIISASCYSVSLILLFVSVTLFGTERSTFIIENLSSPFYIFLSLLIYGMQTGIAEEIFFRGFIAKKLIKRFGFKYGNMLQSLCFGLAHIIAIFQISPIDTAIRITNAIIVGWCFGYIMEKKSDGSIIPVMIAHITYNMLSSFLLLIYLP